jgi:hypothetical protein
MNESEQTPKKRGLWRRFKDNSFATGATALTAGVIATGAYVHNQPDAAQDYRAHILKYDKVNSPQRQRVFQAFNERDDIFSETNSLKRSQLIEAFLEGQLPPLPPNLPPRPQWDEDNPPPSERLLERAGQLPLGEQRRVIIYGLGKQLEELVRLDMRFPENEERYGKRVRALAGKEAEFVAETMEKWGSLQETLIKNGYGHYVPRLQVARSYEEPSTAEQLAYLDSRMLHMRTVIEGGDYLKIRHAVKVEQERIESLPGRDIPPDAHRTALELCEDLKFLQRLIQDPLLRQLQGENLQRESALPGR